MISVQYYFIRNTRDVVAVLAVPSSDFELEEKFVWFCSWFYWKKLIEFAMSSYHHDKEKSLEARVTVFRLSPVPHDQASS